MSRIIDFHTHCFPEKIAEKRRLQASPTAPVTRSPSTKAQQKAF